MPKVKSGEMFNVNGRSNEKAGPNWLGNTVASFPRFVTMSVPLIAHVKLPRFGGQ